MPSPRYRPRSRSPRRSYRERSRSPIRNADERDNRRSGDSRRPRQRSRSRSRSPRRRQTAIEPKQSTSSGATRDQPNSAPVDDGRPNFANSGKLAAETNTFKGVVLKYNEPPEARKPTKSWRLYVFKGKEQLDMIHLNKQSCYLLGRDKLVTDITIEHPSTSKQHAVVQFRQVQEKNEFGDVKSLTKPFVIDLESANGTMVNDEKVPISRFYELRSGDGALSVPLV